MTEEEKLLAWRELMTDTDVMILVAFDFSNAFNRIFTKKFIEIYHWKLDCIQKRNIKK